MSNDFYDISAKMKKLFPPNPEADRNLQQNLKSTLAFLNKLMKEDEFDDEPSKI